MTKGQDLLGAEDAVLEVLRRSGTPQPAQRVTKQLSDRGFDASIIRIAIQYLLDRREIELTHDWQLRPA